MTHRENVLRRLGLKDQGYSLSALSKYSGIPHKILSDCYIRGLGAYKTQPLSVRMKGTFKKGVQAPMSQKLSAPQWAMARCYSLVDSALFGAPIKHDFDLHKQISS
jgi:hypothetical protein